MRTFLTSCVVAMGLTTPALVEAGQFPGDACGGMAMALLQFRASVELTKKGIPSSGSTSSVIPGTPEYAVYLSTYRANGCTQTDLDRNIRESIQSDMRTSAARSRAMAGDGRFCQRQAARFIISSEMPMFTPPNINPPTISSRPMTYEEALSAYYDAGCTKAQLDTDILTKHPKKGGN